MNGIPSLERHSRLSGTRRVQARHSLPMGSIEPRWCPTWELNWRFLPLRTIVTTGFSDFAPIPAYCQYAPRCTFGIRMHPIPSLSVTRQPRPASMEDEYGGTQTG